MSPLMHAAIRGNLCVAKLLLKHEADQGSEVNSVSEFDGKSALILATESGCVDTMEALLIHGADVNYSKPFHKRGTTALMIAIKSGNTEAVDILLSYGADINKKDEDGFTVLSVYDMHQS
ncbi:hypothetical protein Btru_033189 [Bulinus truncatus]|nr:hypothetical protein Btru_033189 [Bulinus truncatus]